LGLHEFLVDTIYFLVATLVLVPIFKWLKLGSVLGYIVAGILIGPMGLELIDNSNSIVQLAELGITLLLFIVGLELSPARLKKLRKSIVFEGGLQMTISMLIFTGIGLLFNFDLKSVLIISIALSLSSTAFTLSYLTDNSQMTQSHGQSCLSILLFQDIIIVPVLALLPLLNFDNSIGEIVSIQTIMFKITIFSALILFCFFALKPVISLIKKTQDQEIYLASFLFLIIGMAMGMEKLGLSMPMGAFIAGIFLANSEIKKNIKSMTLPFKGVLMGLFFMTLGMELDFNFISNQWLKVTLLSLSIMMSKTTVLLIIGKIKSGKFSSGLKTGILLSQSGEFGIILIASALSANLIEMNLNKLLVTSILITMIISPFLARLTEKISSLPKHEHADDEKSSVELNNVIELQVPVDVDKKAA
jgi:monovalent cation:proton antiporter-2 (CPA2) family protein